MPKLSNRNINTNEKQKKRDDYVNRVFDKIDDRFRFVDYQPSPESRLDHPVIASHVSLFSPNIFVRKGRSFSLENPDDVDTALDYIEARLRNSREWKERQKEIERYEYISARLREVEKKRNMHNLQIAEDTRILEEREREMKEREREDRLRRKFGRKYHKQSKRKTLKSKRKSKLKSRAK